MLGYLTDKTSPKHHTAHSANRLDSLSHFLGMYIPVHSSPTVELLWGYAIGLLLFSDLLVFYHVIIVGLNSYHSISV